MSQYNNPHSSMGHSCKHISRYVIGDVFSGTRTKGMASLPKLHIFPPFLESEILYNCVLILQDSSGTNMIGIFTKPAMAQKISKASPPPCTPPLNFSEIVALKPVSQNSLHPHYLAIVSSLTVNNTTMSPELVLIASAVSL